MGWLHSRFWWPSEFAPTDRVARILLAFLLKLHGQPIKLIFGNTCTAIGPISYGFFHSVAIPWSETWSDFAGVVLGPSLRLALSCPKLHRLLPDDVGPPGTTPVADAAHPNRSCAVRKGKIQRNFQN